MNGRRAAFAAHCNVSLCSGAVALLLCGLGSVGCGSKRAAGPDAGASARVDAGRFGLDAGSVIHHGPTGSDGGVADAARPTPAQDATLACIEYLRGLCEQSARCYGGDPASIVECMTNARFCPDVMYAPGSTRTPEGTIACADDWRELACDARPSRPACATPGTRATGEPCIASMQCASLLCTAYGDSCGVCATVVGPGEACDAEAASACDGDHYCSTETHVCTPIPSSALEPSTPLPLGAECEPSTSGCGSNDCRADSESVYRCTPYPTLGQDCSVPKTCANGDSYCDISQICTAFPAVGEGCGVDAFTGMPRWCGADAECVGDAPARTCQARPGPGEICQGRCAEGRWCACDDTACETRSCTRWRYPGESCEEPGDRCIAGECQEGACTIGVERGLFESACAP